MTHQDLPKPGWISAAQRLRKVRGACLTFLDRWAVAQLLSDNPALDRVANDLARNRASTEAEIADPKNKNWSALYRGSVLDD
ncbi:MAG TPA: hypothetical protein VGG44_02305 [Tepidisphaeraceae bacterium]|jgi:hypothetical protein